MAIELKMPALSATMEKGTLAKWLVKAGDEVRPGDPIAEIETDKATMELEASDEGRIASLVIPEGTEGVVVGTIIALIAAVGEAVASPVSPPVAVASATSSLPIMDRPPRADASAVVAAPAAASTKSVMDDSSAKATPLARRIATVKQLSLLGITGSGAHGRIVKADVLPRSLPAPVLSLVSAADTASTAKIGIPVYPPPAGVPVESFKLSTMRKTIARRLTESKQNVPHFYLTVRCNLDPLLKLRQELNASLQIRGVKLSINDMLIKAMALAMTAVPDANVQYGGEELHRFSRVDVAMAVAIDGGLITPVIKNAQSLSLSGISELSKSLAAKARDGKLAPEDYSGGTASISNLGMFGIDEMFPVINPPQALILGIGAGVEQPWNVNGNIALATIMTATGSFDHRAIDGACGAQFMAAFRNLVENPYLIVT